MRRIGAFAAIVTAASVIGLASCSSLDSQHVTSRASAAAEGIDEYAQESLPGGTLDLSSVPKFTAPLVIPPAMPRVTKITQKGGKNIDYYDLAVRQFDQHVLPPSMNLLTTVWSYGSVQHPGTVAEGGSFNYPAFTIEAKWRAPVRVKWRNELVKDPVDCFHASGEAAPGACNYLPHILPVDQTLHWANPLGDCKAGGAGRDCRGTSQLPYTGPVPIVTHLHGAETAEYSDGYPEAWYLPAANDIPASILYEDGTFFEHFKTAFEAAWQDDLSTWELGTAVFQYPNDMRAATLWYHDHTLGMTRLNVYAGPAGFYLLRGGPGDEVKSLPSGEAPARLPGPAPALGDAPGLDYYEIPVVIQGRSFNDDGTLFYPDNREFFEGLEDGDLDDLGVGFGNDVAPIWNPEFFGNVIVVNGGAWPYLNVEPRRYRLRLLNGTNSRFLILKLIAADDPEDPDTWRGISGAITQIGADGGFLPQPLPIDELLLGPAERADVIVDFATINLAAGEDLYMVNIGPDEPFGGGVPGVDFSKAHPGTTGQVMKFVYVPLQGQDKTTPPHDLVLPSRQALPSGGPVRKLTLNEEESKYETLCVDASGTPIPVTQRPCPDGTTSSVCASATDGTYIVEAGAACTNPAYPTNVPVSAIPFGPTAALLGTLAADGTSNPLLWSSPVTETPANGATEVWEIYNFTADAHPMHIHLVQFEVLNRQLLEVDEEGHAVQPAVVLPTVRPPEPWEAGLKDTVIAYPGEVTRVRARFDDAGLYVWHCHILEHEDNEMMRPYCVKHADGSYPTSCTTAGL